MINKYSECGCKDSTCKSLGICVESLIKYLDSMIRHDLPFVGYTRTDIDREQFSIGFNAGIEFAKK